MAQLSSEQIKAVKFFKGSYDELTQLCHEKDLDDYKVNQISRILRQYLFDKHSVVPLVSRTLGRRGGKLKFKCVPHKIIAITGVEFAGQYDGFMPDESAPFAQEVKVIPLNQIGSQILMQYNDTSINVKQLVKYIANKEGGIHFDQTDPDMNEQTFQMVQDYFNVGGRAALTRTLTAVGLVVLEGLRSIRTSVDLVE